MRLFTNLNLCRFYLQLHCLRWQETAIVVDTGTATWAETWEVALLLAWEEVVTWEATRTTRPSRDRVGIREIWYRHWWSRSSAASYWLFVTLMLCASLERCLRLPYMSLYVCQQQKGYVHCLCMLGGIACLCCFDCLVTAMALRVCHSSVFVGMVSWTNRNRSHFCYRKIVWR